MTARVLHQDLWGPRETKYGWLAENDVATTAWAQLAPATPFYLFTPQDADLLTEYQRGWKLPNVFPVNSVGIVTGQDKETIAFTKEVAGQLARDHQIASGKVQAILYRPFDLRWVVYDPKVVTRLRPAVMRHMLAGENLGLIGRRQMLPTQPCNYFWCSKYIISDGVIRSDNHGSESLFPLYLNPPVEGDVNKQAAMRDLSPWPEGKDGRRPNLSPEFVKDLEQRVGLTFVSDGRGDPSPASGGSGQALAKTFGPEDVFHYIYAVLNSPTYRQRYAEFLKMDFPRVPLTQSVELFRFLVRKGAELVALHLLDSPALRQPITRYPVRGDNLVEPGHPRYLAPGEPEPGTGKPLEKGRVYISKDNPKTGKRGQYIERVPSEVYEFQVGGYQVCEKWLKDRRGRVLTNADIEHYERIVVALKETIRIMAEIDQAIDSSGGWPRAFES